MLIEQKKIVDSSKEELEHKNKLFEELKVGQNVYKCPSCSTDLKFVDNKVWISSDRSIDPQQFAIVKQDIARLKKHIPELESKYNTIQNTLDKYNSIKQEIDDITSQYEDSETLNYNQVLKETQKDYEDLKKYQTSQYELQKQLDNLYKQGLSGSITSFERSLKTTMAEIETIKKKIGTNLVNKNEDELVKLVKEQQRNKEKLEYINSNIASLSEERSNYEKQVNLIKEKHITLYQEIKPVKDIEKSLKKRQNELKDLENTLQSHKDILHKIERYQEYEKSYEAYRECVKQIKVLTAQEIEHRKQHAAAVLLKEEILEAESISLLNIIASINTHSQVYLYCFFPDDPITVRLTPFKETKKGKNITSKPQINLEIDYKGMDADINMLSGGELSRVILAFALALGEIFNTPIMLLDECTSSLDQDLTEIVLEGIKDNFKDRLVVLVVHQGIAGMFDRVIETGVTKPLDLVIFQE